MKIREGLRLREVMGQVTIVGNGVHRINFNNLITLNASAAYLWQEIEGKDFTTVQLASLLVKRYGIDSGTALQDAVTLVGEWMKYEIVEEWNKK